MKTIVFSLMLLLGVADSFAADPSIAFVRVPQDSIKVHESYCTGVIELDARDADGDSLLLSIQISSDNGATWMVPLQSDFFVKTAPGAHRLRFSVPGRHGNSCRARVTAYDRLPTSGTERLIPAAGHAFLMGGDSARLEERPRHRVALSRNYWIDTTEMSEARFKLFKPDYIPQYLALYFYDNDRPIDNCFWHWAVLYCNWRSKQEGFDTCYSNLPSNNNSYKGFFEVRCDLLKNGFRLPTESEWEYACRAGSAARYPWGEDSAVATVGQYCWYWNNFADTIHAPAKRSPNRFGLYDMLGQMLELCNDWYDSTYYAHSPLVDPPGPPAYVVGSSADPFRVTRGGHFLSSPYDMTCSARLGNFSSARHPQTFRCVRTALEESE
jgi:formylglycine-generating enzyme required for sulfatase activity